MQPHEPISVFQNLPGPARVRAVRVKAARTSLAGRVKLSCALAAVSAVLIVAIAAEAASV